MQVSHGLHCDKQKKNVIWVEEISKNLIWMIHLCNEGIQVKTKQFRPYFVYKAQGKEGNNLNCIC